MIRLDIISNMMLLSPKRVNVAFLLIQRESNAVDGSGKCVYMSKCFLSAPSVGNWTA